MRKHVAVAMDVAKWDEEKWLAEIAFDFDAVGGKKSGCFHSKKEPPQKEAAGSLARCGGDLEFFFTTRSKPKADRD